MSAETETVEWIYMGQRLAAGNKVRHAWLDDRGETLLFGKISGGMVGQTYAVEISRDDGTTTVHGYPRYLAEQATRHATDRQREEWRAEHEVAKQLVAGEQAEKAAIKAGDEIDRALEVLRRHHARLRSYRKQSAFRQWVDAEVSRPPAKDER